VTLQRVNVILFSLLALAFFGKVHLFTTLVATPDFPPHRATLSATAALFIVFILPILKLAGRQRIPALVALNGIVTLVLLADLVHFRFFDDVLSAAEVAHADQVAPIAATVATRVAGTDIWFFADIVLGVLAWALLRGGADDSRVPGRVRAALACAAGVLAVAPARLMWTDPDEVFLYATERREVVSALGVLPYHVYDVARRLHQIAWGMRLTPDERQAVEAFFDERREPPLAPSALFGRAHGRNVIVVMAESLTSLPVDLVIDGQEVMPALSRFARESVRFTNFFDQTHLGTTADAEFSSMQGLLPLPDAVVATAYGANDFAGLPAVLRERGYDTFSANVMPGGFWNMRGMHGRFGFARSYFRGDFQDGEALGMGLSDEVFFDQIEGRLLTAREPFLAYLITLSHHLPYELPAHHRRLDLGALEGSLVGRYLQSAHHFDRTFGAFVERLRYSGLLDRSVVVVYGDHRGFWEETPQLPPLLGFAGGDRFRTWTVERRLPLLMRLPDGDAARVVDAAGSHVDLVPTLLSILGVPSHGEVTLGRDLLSTRPPLVVFRDGSVIADDRLAIAADAGGAAECFQLASGGRASCDWLETARRTARRHMEVSDLVVRANLVAGLRRPAPPPPVRVICHRGNSEDAPENTLAAIEAAFAVGCDLSEVDVRLSRDGVPVIIHDETVDRTTNGTGNVADLTLAQLKAIDARIPTLAEALRATHGRGTLLLDVPVAGMGALIAETFRTAGIPQSQALVATWDDEQRRDFATQMPAATIVQADAPPERWEADYFAGRRALGVAMFDIPTWAPEFLRQARAAGMPVWVYTVNDAETMREVIRLGVDGFETDVPRTAVGVARSTRRPARASRP
jgi:phosphoglycerol transferase MdoB-like AlkP superfamily enzyme/glycerophosphoryl diester phosphodiesterase